ncbi:ATP-binding protein [Bradyrhizobium zhanjiangense]|uniref:HSP90 family molecular chaperone-like protein n=1 Tax=Bradyrhizobium zhanjiangense TaxID=1325107 RepID=A0A4V1KUM3_9BRAD|nr:ATP-binding protein [Bradyrhizobium zhanjiangense]RXG84829.1 HSP90 family molecular chaperone-like protein [Bradyrhizobium zhanjiangense]
MKLNAKSDSQERIVGPDDVRVGKDVIEILTSGMYVSPLSIYREYVQNAADSIDQSRGAGDLGAGRVSVSIDHGARSVAIRDDGVGIPAEKVPDVLLAVGGSRKRGTSARGFRGVGRLSGLAYCRQIEFITKAKGANRVARVVWDCRKLKELVASNVGADDLRMVMAGAVSITTESAAATDPSFFEVRISDIARLRSDLLLNEHLIGEYLGQVAPVRFSSDFSFGAEIDAELKKRQKLSRLDLSVNGRTITRPHRDELLADSADKSSRIKEIEFFELADVDGDIGAIGWLAHHDYVRSLPANLGVRGLRARVGDLQVGESNLFEDSYKETRFNSWTIGEIHMLDRRIVPNARRDNFEANHHYSNVLVQVGPVAAKISQRCRQASISRTALQVVENLTRHIEDRLKQQKPRIERAELSKLKAAAVRATAKAGKIEDEQDRKRSLTRLAKVQKKLSALTPRRGPATVAVSEVATLIAKFVTNREQREKLVMEIKRLVD